MLVLARRIAALSRWTWDLNKTTFDFFYIGHLFRWHQKCMHRIQYVKMISTSLLYLYKSLCLLYTSDAADE